MFFEAAGGSTPELFISFISIFTGEKDTGFGTIVGSAVFNILFVLALCAWINPGLKLSWYPIARDSSCYCLGLMVILLFGDSKFVLQKVRSFVLSSFVKFGRLKRTEPSNSYYYLHFLIMSFSTKLCFLIFRMKVKKVNI